MSPEVHRFRRRVPCTAQHHLYVFLLLFFLLQFVHIFVLVFLCGLGRFTLGLHTPLASRYRSSRAMARRNRQATRPTS